MSPVDSSFLMLNEVAAAIWLGADGRTRLADIVERSICSKFEIEPCVAHRDAQKFVQELLWHRIVVISESPIHNAPVPILPSLGSVSVSSPV